MVSISTPEFDLNGHVLIDAVPNTTEGETVRRVNRAATLDGDVAITDRGFSEGDRTLTITWRTKSREHNASVARLVKSYALLNVSMPGAMYLAAPSSFEPRVDESTITLYVKSKLSE